MEYRVIATFPRGTCRNGHDFYETGRLVSGRCLECRRIRDRAYKRQARSEQRRMRVLAKADPGWV
jgi:hypothetical protein